MKGYIAIICRSRELPSKSDDHVAYVVRFPDIDECSAAGATMADAMHEAERELNRYIQKLVESGGDLNTMLPKPKPATAMLGEAKRQGAVAAVWVRPRHPVPPFARRQRGALHANSGLGPICAVFGRGELTILSPRH